VGSVGSISDAAASNAYRTLTTFDMTDVLGPGMNEIAVAGSNGPAFFAGGCGPSGCTYQINPAGVVSAGTIHWR
jgi:hypothetical protein